MALSDLVAAEAVPVIESEFDIARQKKLIQSRMAIESLSDPADRIEAIVLWKISLVQYMQSIKRRQSAI